MIKVLKSGMLTTIQDKGRLGFASLGVPISGAMDSFSAGLANKIINNANDDAVIEITLGNCSFQFLTATEISITGADCNAILNDKKVHVNKRIPINKNDVLTFEYPKLGVRTYIAVKGGIQSKKVMNSRSFYKNITSNYKLNKEDTLLINSYPAKINQNYTAVKIDKRHFLENKLICYKGPEFELLSKENQQKIFNSQFSIAKENSRMGYKLNEYLINELPQILTAAVLSGTVQLTPSGTLIILMRDCQTTGGYPRILQLSEQSINILSQKTTNDIIRFSLNVI